MVLLLVLFQKLCSDDSFLVLHPRRSLVYLRSTYLLYPPSYFTLLEKMTILINGKMTILITGKMTSIMLKKTLIIMMKKMISIMLKTLIMIKKMMFRWLGRCSATPQGISSSSRCQPLLYRFVWHWCLYWYLISMPLFNFIILSSQGRWSLDVENAWLSLHRFEILSRK